MSEGSLGKGIRAPGSADCETPKNIEDLVEFADSYLLGPQQLATELTVSSVRDPGQSAELFLDGISALTWMQKS